MAALTEASAAIFVVDGQFGPTEGDQEIASWLRITKQYRSLLAVNKCESPDESLSSRRPSFGRLVSVNPMRFQRSMAAASGELLDALVEHLPAL